MRIHAALAVVSAFVMAALAAGCAGGNGESFEPFAPHHFEEQPQQRIQQFQVPEQQQPRQDIRQFQQPGRIQEQEHRPPFGGAVEQ